MPRPSKRKNALQDTTEILDRILTAIDPALDRMHDARAGYPKAASYDSDGGSPELWCFTHERPVTRCHDNGALCDGEPPIDRSDPAGNAGVQAAMFGDQAAQAIREVDDLLRRLEIAAKGLEFVVARYTPRQAFSAELRQVERENDPGCTSCARGAGPNGGPIWSPSIGHTDVKGTLPHPMALCRWCRDFVRSKGKLPTPQQVTDHERGITIMQSAG